VKNVVRDVVVYGAGDVLLRGATLITLPLYTRYLRPSDYGAMSLVLALSTFATAFLIMGLDVAFARYYFEAKTFEQKRALTSTVLMFVSGWGVLVTLLLLPFTGAFSRWAFGTDTHSTLFAFALIGAPLVLVNQLLGQILRNEFKALLFSALAAASSTLTVGASLFFVVVLGLGVKGIFLGTIVGAASVLPIRLVLARGYFARQFDLRILWRLILFGLPLVPTAIAWWVFDLSDRLVLGKFSSLSELGLYTVAVSVANALALFTSALGQAWSPHAFRVYTETPELAAAFYGRTLTYLLVSFGVLCVGVTAFSRPALDVLTTQRFHPAAQAVGPLALGFVAWATIQVTGSGISLLKKTTYYAIYSWVAAALNVGLNILLVPRFGMIAAAWTTFGAYLTLTIAYLITGQRLWPIEYEGRRAVSASLVIFGFTIAFIHVPDPGVAIGFALAVVWTGGFGLTLLALRVIKLRDLTSIWLMVRRFRTQPA
jgi:O-antigen/teichoic acid export membrane protein